MLLNSHLRHGSGFAIGSGSAIGKNAGSGSALNQCGSTTLPYWTVYNAHPVDGADVREGAAGPDMLVDSSEINSHYNVKLTVIRPAYVRTQQTQSLKFTVFSFESGFESGSGSKLTAGRIRSRIRNKKLRIRNTEFKYFLPKKCIPSSQKMQTRLFIPDNGFQIWFFFLFIPDPESALDPGSGSATLVEIGTKWTSMWKGDGGGRDFIDFAK